MGTIFGGPYNHKLEGVFLNWDFAKVPRPSRCDDCPLEPQCAGGCPAANLYYMRNIYQSCEQSCRLARIEYDIAHSLYRYLVKKNCGLFIEEMNKPEY